MSQLFADQIIERQQIDSHGKVRAESTARTERSTANADTGEAMRKIANDKASGDLLAAS